MLEITKEVKSFLKNCDTLCVHMERPGDRIMIRLRFLKNIEKTDKHGFVRDTGVGFSEKEFSYIQNYGLVTGQKAYFSVEYGELDMLKAVLRTNDKIYLSTIDNSNAYIEDAGLHNDCLFISIYRNDKQIVRSATIESSITPDNLARAIKRVVNA